MIQDRATGAVEASAAAALAYLSEVVARLQEIQAQGTDRDRVEILGALESVKGAASAAQARVTVALRESQLAAQRDAGVPAARAGAGVAAQVALARRESPHRGRQLTELAVVLVGELHHTMAALSAGLISEWRASLVARETAHLTRRTRAEVDRLLADVLPHLSDQEVIAEVRRLSYELEPAAADERARRARKNRCVTLRPGPDAMALLTALLPAADGLSAYASLARAADTARATGDPRSRGEVMADALVQRVVQPAASAKAGSEPGAGADDGATAPAGSRGADPGDGSSAVDGFAADSASGANDGAANGANDGAADATDPAKPGTAGRTSIEIQLVMTPQTLLGIGDRPDEPALLTGLGPIPAGTARDLLRDPKAEVFLRRVFTDDRGRLVQMETHRRRFDARLRSMLIARDQRCRTPFCDAPVRHIDHVDPSSAGGQTTLNNGQGLCEACNYSKQAPGWQAWAMPDDARHVIEFTTPAGHTYQSTPPNLPGTSIRPVVPDGAELSTLERRLARLLDVA